MQKTYPVIIETDAEGGFSAYFPDLPGCVAAGDTIEDCFVDAQQALTLHLAGMVEDGDALPMATPLADVKAEPEVQVADILLVTAPVAGRKQRINMTMDSAVLAAIDAVTGNRSAFLEDAALAELRRRSQAG